MSGWRSSFAIALSLCLVVGPTSARADDANPREYAVLYGGNMDDADAHAFSALLYNLGGSHTWTGATQWSYAGDQRDVNHGDLTNGWAGVDPYLPGNKADLLYYSGHGFPNGIRFFDPSVIGDPDREEDQNNLPDNIGPQEAPRD